MNKKGLITITTLTIGILTSPFLAVGAIRLQTSNQIYQSIEEVPQKEVGLVLGAAAYGDRLSDILRDRVDTAIELYEADKIDILFMSGGANEVGAMEKYAIEKGVPTSAITKDPDGLNTLASVKNIAELDQSIVIVTQGYHLPRSLFMANSMDIDAVGIVADKQPYIEIAQYKKREVFATSKAILDVFVLD